MSDTVIKVENLSKKYILSHQSQERYIALRDVMDRGAKNLGKKLLSPFTSHHSPLTTSQEEFYALKDVSFEIKQGDRVGIIGRNGAGKSTLLKILSRITEPTSGRIEITGRVASLLEVGTGFHPELTGRENIYLNGAILGMGKAEIKRKFDEIVDFAEVEKFLDTPVKRYSSGMYVRLAFAVAAHLEPEILVVDEVLAVGDAQFQKKCLGKMEDVGREGRTVLFVSHNLGALLGLCNVGVYLESGTIRKLGIIESLVADYTRNLTNADNSNSWNNKVIKHLSVTQVDRTLEILFRYETEKIFKTPNLGFLISDERGAPITATNPIKSGRTEFGQSTLSGMIKVVIKSPILANGTYSLTIWFDDGYSDYIYLPNCIYFEVINMGFNVNKNTLKEGSVLPECEWNFR